MDSENSMNDDVRDSDTFDVDSELDAVVAAEVTAVYAELDSDSDEFEDDDEFDDEFDEDELDDFDDVDDAEVVVADSAHDTAASSRVHLSSLPVTGEARVDDALARLGDLDGMPIGEHVAVYEDVQRRLHDTLADLAGQ